MNNESSGVNTVLIVILLLIVVGALVWFFRGKLSGQDSAPENDKKLEVNVNLPTGTEEKPTGGGT